MIAEEDLIVKDECIDIRILSNLIVNDGWLTFFQEILSLDHSS